MPTSDTYLRVAVTGPLRRTFTYRVPSHFETPQPGQRVLVPFGRRKMTGYVVECLSQSDVDETKPILSLIDQKPLWPASIIKLCLWMADYYFCNPSDSFEAALPPQLRGARAARYVWKVDRPDYLPANLARLARAGKRVSAAGLKRIAAQGGTYLSRLVADGIIAQEFSAEAARPEPRTIGYRVSDPAAWARFGPPKKGFEQFDGSRTAAELRASGVSDHYRRKAVEQGVLEPVKASEISPLDALEASDTDYRSLDLTVEQQNVVTAVPVGKSDGFGVHLLHGVTGSGKTLVYCHLADRVLKAGRSVLILTPEIALSASTLAYFRGYFGDRATILHSGLSPRERLANWQGIRDGRYRLVVGPRSALFAPLTDPGLIIVDEEHDDSYKQKDPAPRFHGRDSAIKLAQLLNIPILLGSASPSIESYHHAVTGRYQLHRLTSRPAGAVLPAVRLIDMRDERLAGDLPFVSFTLKMAVEEHLARDRQVILYLNRRGYAPHLKCTACGHVPSCRQCQVRLTYHRTGSKMVCHYCGISLPACDVCEKCGGHDFLHMGAGTQKVEEAVTRLFADARPARFDSDAVASRFGSWRILQDFARRKHNLLLGTQMVTKGLDMPGVTLVGVLMADLGLDMPDFRASERTFSRLLQVAGRSGRSQEAGKVLIQTFDPDSRAIRLAASQDYEAFFRTEIKTRDMAGYPPFVRLINFVLESEGEPVLEQQADHFRQRLDDLITRQQLGIRLLGPAPNAVYRLRGRFRRHVLAKVPPTMQTTFLRLLSRWEREERNLGLAAGVRLIVDVDPADLM